MMAKTMILPAALRYQAEVGRGGRTPTKAAGVDNAAQARDLLETLTGDDQRVPDGDRRRWTRPLDHHADGDAVRPRQAHRATRSSRRWPTLRTLGDKLETMVADDLWPLPTYREMLFIK